jgi:AcrR family transcriptional regulator
MNPKLFIRDPELSELGRNIIRYSVKMISDMGFEAFTFRKLAQDIGTTEAGIYRYFENKHRLLIYIIDWFWTWMEYRVVFHTNNIDDPKKKILVVIQLLTFKLVDTVGDPSVDKEKVFRIAITEASKSYLTNHVSQDNKDQLFKPYKDLCARIADIFKEYNSSYPYPRSLASTLIETVHCQYFFWKNLPSLTDFAGEQNETRIISFFEDLVFASLRRT